MTEEGSWPREIPDVPDDVTEDEPENGASGLSASNASRAPFAQILTPSVLSPEKQHELDMDKAKHSFARHLIWGALGCVLVIGVLVYFTPERSVNNASLLGILDFFKLLATTALGFLFGKGMRSGS